MVVGLAGRCASCQDLTFINATGRKRTKYEPAAEGIVLFIFTAASGSNKDEHGGRCRRTGEAVDAGLKRSVFRQEQEQADMETRSY
jgi:hypothetical protein